VQVRTGDGVLGSFHLDGQDLTVGDELDCGELRRIECHQPLLPLAIYGFVDSERGLLNSATDYTFADELMICMYLASDAITEPSCDM
jgi:hypothetical protein